MNISDIQPGQGKIDLEVEIMSLEEPREFEKFGKVLKVADAIVKDDSGEIKMSFWNEDIDKVKPGMTIKVTNGYCSEFKGEKQLSCGKFGSFEVLRKTNEKKQETDSEEETKDKNIEEKTNVTDIPEEDLM